METKDEKDSLFSVLVRGKQNLASEQQMLLQTFKVIFSDQELLFDQNVIGSFGEGFANLSVLSNDSSDVDIMAVSKHGLVFEHHCSPVPDSTWLFQMQVCPNNSGYVRLRLCKHGNIKNFGIDYPDIATSLEYDSLSDCNYLTNAFIHVIADSHLCAESPFMEPCDFFTLVTTRVSGPSLNRTSLFPYGSYSGKVEYDDVFALRCPEWPSVASEWISRERHKGWPSPEFISQHTSKGCYVVPVGCKECDRMHLDWRISFVHVEQALVKSMNTYQWFCFHLLRQLKKTIFGVKMPNVITSYIIKTTLFWTLEETSPDLWQRSKLLAAGEECLDKLITFVQNGNCPNYFIRTCNLFKKTFSKIDKQMVLQTCLDVKKSQLKFMLETSPFLNRLGTLKASGVNSAGFIKNITKLVNSMPVKSLIESMLAQLVPNSRPELIQWCRNIQQNIKGVINTRECDEETKMLLDYIHTFTDRWLKSCTLRTPYSQKNSADIELIDFDLEDVYSVASFCHLQMVAGSYTRCNGLLTKFIEIQKQREYRNVSLHGNSFKKLFTYLSIIIQMDAPPVIFDMIFLQIEQDTLPTPLQTEINSSLINIPNFSTKTQARRVLVVDPLVYACFLRFWCSIKMDENIEKLKARDAMVWCCGLDSISYKAVALNLLAYCHIQLEEYETAFKVLCRALSMTPVRRSTLVYIATLVNTKLRRP
ncbi:uncharacterized protein LOC117315823 [Pecten maximus]|uniref:uncharacterized protein LOC117315823 n=1 Tax=Pecten maximus TaxID=6579 RepID=UPI001458653B|nr:uncharacterized protein LOC117315823 [Pecten maximus]